MLYNYYEFLSLLRRQASINFSLILSFQNANKCIELDYINEGILLKATDYLNFTKNLNFYYSTVENNNNDPDIVPKVTIHGQCMVNLNYTSKIFNVTATFNNRIGLLNFSKNGKEILN